MWGFGAQWLGILRRSILRLGLLRPRRVPRVAPQKGGQACRVLRAAHRFVQQVGGRTWMTERQRVPTTEVETGMRITQKE